MTRNRGTDRCRGIICAHPIPPNTFSDLEMPSTCVTFKILAVDEILLQSMYKRVDDGDEESV